jgi:chromosome segregation ATPase
MTMDMGQLSQMTAWLDEEHRRDKAELVRLQQRVESQAVELQEQARLVQELEGRLASLQAQLLRLGQLEASIGQLKSEVVQMIGQAEERRQQETRETERVRAVERDNTAKALNEIRRDLQRLPRMAEEQALRKAEQQRLGEVSLTLQQDMAGMKQEVESKIRSIPFLEDSRQQDGKRIARLQQETLEAMKRIEQQGSKMQMIEDTLQRHERDSGELQQNVAQLRSKQREFIDGQLLEVEQIKRQFAEWVEKLGVELKKMEDHGARMRTFSDEFREDRQVVAKVASFHEQIRREQTQVAELQRLAEEREKRQLEQWLEENEKRWKKELLRWDHQVAEDAKRHQQISEKFRAMDEQLGLHQVNIDAQWKVFETQISYQTQEARRWQGEMTKLIEDRPKKQ